MLLVSTKDTQDTAKIYKKTKNKAKNKRKVSKTQKAKVFLPQT
jgi:hypothetical protein